jgi:hypothetical protein
LKLKHSWNIHQTFILFISSLKSPCKFGVTANSHVDRGLQLLKTNWIAPAALLEKLKKNMGNCMVLR